jgi:tetratricopeptide (TPR) repeat protein
MAKRLMKHNPAFLSVEELVAGFVVRHADLDLVLEHIREQPESAPQHILLIGPRGIGKTTMVLRVAAAVRADAELDKKWYPLVFGEEAYQVGTAAELWLEAILHLADQTGEARYKMAYEELRKQRDEKRLYEQVLAVLMDFADAQKKRLLVVVENMNMLLGEQLSADDGWTLRHTLQNERRILLLGTATTRFDEIDNVEKAMYDLFWTHDLRPLELEECRALWQSISGKEIAARRIRPVQILTGGSPRLLAILASFAADVSFRDLMLKLTDLVDDHTNYFKSNLESLPIAERKVYATLADIWSPATAREVADAARINVNVASAQLHRLVQRGAVTEVKPRGRKASYQVAERMYNVYHLMRRRGGEDSRVRAVVDFMVHMYGEGGLVEVTQSIVDEACRIEPGAREDHFRLVSSLLQRVASPSVRADILMSIDPRFFTLEDAPYFVSEILRDAPGPSNEEHAREQRSGPGMEAYQPLVDVVVEIASGSVPEHAGTLAQQAIAAEPRNPVIWAFLAIVLSASGKVAEAKAAIRKACGLSPRPARSRFYKLGGTVLNAAGDKVGAVECYKKALSMPHSDPSLAKRLGEILFEMNDVDAAEKYFRKAIGLNPADSAGWNAVARVLVEAGKAKQAEQTLRQAISLGVGDPTSRLLLGLILLSQRRYEEGEKRCVEGIFAAKDATQSATGWLSLADYLMDLGRWDRAFEGLRQGLVDAEAVRQGMPLVSKMVVNACAAGHTARVLSALKISPAREQLEPLVVALQILTDEEHNSPQEVVEVAKDIVQQIEETKRKRTEPSSAPPPKKRRRSPSLKAT